MALSVATVAMSKSKLYYRQAGNGLETTPWIEKKREFTDVAAARHMSGLMPT